MTWEAVTSLLWLLVSVVLVIGLAYWFTRYVAGRGLLGPGQKGRGMEILAQLSLGRDQRLALAQVGGRYFLLGITAGQITTLAEFTKEEAALWQERPEVPDGQPPSFREALHTVLQQKRRR
ncbi:MAG: flagellar biosynthetic protein FliO [Oscillibacter sp.]|nr:flagellar biosynthetic protein FliO [Oscillibacter sp.]